MSLRERHTLHGIESTCGLLHEKTGRSWQVFVHIAGCPDLEQDLVVLAPSTKNHRFPPGNQWKTLYGLLTNQGRFWFTNRDMTCCVGCRSGAMLSSALFGGERSLRRFWVDDVDPVLPGLWVHRYSAWPRALRMWRSSMSRNPSGRDTYVVA